MNILLVEDDRSMRMLIESMLDKTGVHNIFSCGTYEDAARLLTQHKFDGVISDLVLESGSGLDIGRQCFDKQIPVVFCTSTSDQHNKKIMYSMGWIIEKPVLFEAINQAVRYFRGK